MKWILLALALALSPRAAALPAQELEPELSEQDRAAILLVGLGELIGPPSQVAELRIWVRPEWRSDERRWVSHTETTRAAIAERYPTVRFLPVEDEGFECPPGVSVAMPIQGCPIREAGIIVNVGPIAHRPGVGWVVDATKTQSSAAGDKSWRAGFGVVVAPVGAKSWRATGRFGMWAS